MGRRYCTFPKLPFKLREKFEDKFGDLCKTHDEKYRDGDCKLCSDYDFIKQIAKRGHPFIALTAFIAVQAPWVWIKWFKK